MIFDDRLPSMSAKDVVCEGEREGKEQKCTRWQNNGGDGRVRIRIDWDAYSTYSAYNNGGDGRVSG